MSKSSPRKRVENSAPPLAGKGQAGGLVDNVARSIRRRDATLRLWGDPTAGEVNDWIYVLTDRLCMMVYSMPPGHQFTQSVTWKPIYAADELYFVVKGTLALANPETGQVIRADAGEALRFCPNTWHHGFNQGAGELQVLELFTPASPQDTVARAGDGYGDSRPPLKQFKYRRDELIGAWPHPDGALPRSIQKIDPRDTLWRLEGEEHILVGIWLSTPALTAGRIELLPGQSSGVRAHGGELAVFVERGRLNVLLPQAEPAARWLELQTEDAFFAPGGTPHRYFNMIDEPVDFLFGVAPQYLPNGPSPVGET